MRTIGRKWPSSRGDYQAMCDVCGVHWRRSQMARKEDGTLVCPDDARGRVAIDLDRANAESGRLARDRRQDGAGYDDDP